MTTGQQPVLPNVLLGTYLGYLGFSYKAVAWMVRPAQWSSHWLTPETGRDYGIFYYALNPPRTLPLAGSPPTLGGVGG